MYLAHDGVVHRYAMLLVRLGLMLSSISDGGVAAPYMALAYRRFIQAYARRHYEDAAIWVRRIAEAFCLSILTPTYHGYLLGDLTWYLWEHRPEFAAASVYSLVSSRPLTKVCELAEEMGVCFATATVYEDLKTMAWYGNKGAHAHSALVRNAGALVPRGMQAEPAVFTAVIRILIAFIHLHEVELQVSRL